MVSAEFFIISIAINFVYSFSVLYKKLITDTTFKRCKRYKVPIQICQWKK